MSDKMYEDAHGGEKRNRMIAPPPPLSAVSQSAVPPLPKKARYDPNRISQPAKLQQLRIDTSMSQSKMKVLQLSRAPSAALRLLSLIVSSRPTN